MRNNFRASQTSMGELAMPVPSNSFRNDIVPPTTSELLEGSQNRPASALDDRSLVSLSRSGDQDAATELYSRYALRLTALVARQCSVALARNAGVEDIVQSVFGSFFRGVGHGYYDIPDEHELWKLLLVIALNKVRAKASYYHAAKRDARRTIHGAEAAHRIESRSSERDSTSEHLEFVVDEILEQLPPQNRSMVKLRLDGCDVAEVALITGRSRRSVERILQEARLKLRELLREDD
jgi:RNA polymerase sigma-70 factor (ECF subfamily)